MSDLPIFADEGARVGIVTVGELGPVIHYDPSWASARQAFPISLSMSLDQDNWGQNSLSLGG